MTMTYALEAKGLSVRYGGVTANDGVSMRIAPGEIRGLIGPNGAGKSTFIDALSGRRATAAGSVHLAGRDITALGVVERRLLGLSRSFQRTSIFPGMRIGAQMELAASKIPDADADEVMRELGLDRFADRHANEIGYGDQRRLDIALALVGRPSVLLLDEPMAGLSIEESMKLARHLRELARHWGVSVLLVEHDMEVVFGISDSITVLETGKLLAEGAPAEIRAHPKVREAYLGSAA
ncbi:ABC transporter ATP-binding protein [Aromatoleum anaerobium]|uniref:ATP-binding cassette domain-containing protein n=1 Tax=Aromatoleum anaerobium TaxID=182180 RepID=A0ABX1PKC6_9RHOO|nr:ABC transporter ATP-binding protein [Aromatoleum anaerobium]MCK0506568.1 ABC transporter ATP-binding protein [Aromatoleum anaerobium]